MFGYITPVLSVLTEEQKQRYRSFYCGVCHALKKRHGLAGRVSLSNDMTFLALLLSSLYEPETGSASARCGVHPLKSHPYLSSKMIDYAADMNALLFYYKCEDQRMDDRSLLGKAGESLFRGPAQKIGKDWPAQAEGVKQALTDLWEEEKQSSPDPDRLCNLSGEMLGAVFVPDPRDTWSPLLRSVGVSLGRFIYWMDACVDLETDRKKGNYNPLLVLHGAGTVEEKEKLELLKMLIAECAAEFERLPLVRDVEILRSVLYSGVWTQYAMKLKKEKGGAAHGQ